MNEMACTTIEVACTRQRAWWSMLIVQLDNLTCYVVCLVFIEHTYMYRSSIKVIVFDDKTH